MSSGSGGGGFLNRVKSGARYHPPRGRGWNLNKKSGPLPGSLTSAGTPIGGGQPHPVFVGGGQPHPMALPTPPPSSSSSTASPPQRASGAAATTSPAPAERASGHRSFGVGSTLSHLKQQQSRPSGNGVGVGSGAVPGGLSYLTSPGGVGGGVGGGGGGGSASNNVDPHSVYGATSTPGETEGTAHAAAVPGTTANGGGAAAAADDVAASSASLDGGGASPGSANAASTTEAPASTNIGADATASAPAPVPAAYQPSYRDKRFGRLLGSSGHSSSIDVSAGDVVDLGELKRLAWNGVPSRWRPMVWQMLLGYLPCSRTRREQTLQRKRREYADAVPQYFDVPSNSRTRTEQQMLRQILVDVPRTAPEVPLFHQAVIQRCLERLLYVWAIRHPASGYVQGMNDLATPLFVVFLSSAFMEGGGGGTGGGPGEDGIEDDGLGSDEWDRAGKSFSAMVESIDAAKLDAEVIANAEADTYWCLTKLLDNIQDHYTAGQPGLQRQMFRLEELVRRIDLDLHNHLTENGIQFTFFSFRWMNNLLMRELPLQAIVRLWDTLLSEDSGGSGFEDFHVYVCAAFLKHFSETIQNTSAEQLMLFLQELPTKEWGLSHMETLLSEAFILSTSFKDAQHHLTGTGGT